MTSRHLKRAAALVAAVGLAVALTACSGGGSSTSTDGGSAESGGTLTIAGTGSPNLDPAGYAPPYGWPVYSTLVHITSEGDYIPDLATDWAYTDDTNTKFEITLRDGVEFSNGEAFDADAVAASMTRFITAPGPVAISAGPVESVTAEGTDKVLITYTKPVPYDFAIQSIAQIHSFGAILAPASLADEESIPTDPIGAGPYKVDTENSTSAAYTFIPTETYWNQDAIKYDKVVITTIEDPAAQLAAAQSGQVNWATAISAASVSAAESSGLQVISQAGNTIAAAAIQNRGEGPLADQRVRQAINYATPREDIVTAVYGGAGTATSSMGVPTLLGYNAADDDMYALDVQKAKDLMDEAGYGDGITVSAITQPAYSNLAQAMAGALAEIGITMDVTVNSGTFPEFVSALQSKEYDISIAANPAIDVYALVTFTMAPGGTANAFSVEDPTLDQMMVDAAAKPADEQADAFAAITAYLDDQAYYVPIGLVAGTSAAGAGVQNVPSEVAVVASLVDPFSPDDAAAWYGE